MIGRIMCYMTILKNVDINVFMKYMIMLKCCTMKLFLRKCKYD